MSGSIRVNNDYFNALQDQLSLKNERPARLELLINIFFTFFFNLTLCCSSGTAIDMAN